MLRLFPKLGSTLNTARTAAPTPSKTATVFASASGRTPQSFLDAAADLGRALAAAGVVCVHGGGKQGCMGALHRATKAAGGVVHCVIHETFVDEELALGADELIITRGDDLSERKRLLFERGQCLISLPGGVGTIDELFDAIAGVHVGLSTLPICLVNTDGYYDGVIAQLERAQTDQLLRKPWRELLTVVDTPEEALQWFLANVGDAPRPTPPALQGFLGGRLSARRLYKLVRNARALVAATPSGAYAFGVATGVWYSALAYYAAPWLLRHVRLWRLSPLSRAALELAPLQ